MRADRLQQGDVVEVRSAAEILATLDARGMLDGLPFMPEMTQFCGRRFVVDRRAERICDTIFPLGSRRLPNTVLLEDLRCDGSAHDGCQAECRLFWNEAWLRRASSESVPDDVDDDARDALLRVTTAGSRHTSEIDGQVAERYRCQATELRDASQPLSTSDPRAYVREYTSGNVGFWHFLKVTARAVLSEPLYKVGRLPDFPIRGPRKKTDAGTSLNLQPGDLVRVRPREQIVATLDANGKNRGLWFDREMLPFCGGTFSVRQRISRFIDERLGQMIELKSDCVTLDGVVCSGERSAVRWFCPRAIFPYWRETWLERVEKAPTGPEHRPLKSIPLPVEAVASGR